LEFHQGKKKNIRGDYSWEKTGGDGHVVKGSGEKKKRANTAVHRVQREGLIPLWEGVNHSEKGRNSQNKKKKKRL